MRSLLLLLTLTLSSCTPSVGDTWLEREQFFGMCDNKTYNKECVYTAIGDNGDSYNCYYNEVK